MSVGFWQGRVRPWALLVVRPAEPRTIRLTMPPATLQVGGSYAQKEMSNDNITVGVDCAQRNSGDTGKKLSGKRDDCRRV
jgi:hypothetical protein